MLIENIHERLLTCNIADAAILLDDLSKKNSLLWPSQYWPRDSFDGPLTVGAIGAHGGTRYVVEHYQPGQSVGFRFIQPKGYDGIHRFDLIEIDSDTTLIKHTLQFQAKGLDLWIWRLIIQWVHNALIEDAFDCAQTHLLNPLVKPNRWPIYVHFLRHALGGTRLLVNGISRLFKITKKNEMEAINRNNLTMSPICNVIVGFRNYTQHATRSRYISFSLEQQSAMCALLLELASRPLSQKMVDGWPEHLFKELVNYGLVKPVGTFSEKIKNCFNNILNENRLKVILYQGKKYWITSFIFMAFNSQQPKEFIRETVILPYWSKAFAAIVFKLYTQNLSLELLQELSPSILKRLLKHGVLIQKQDYPEIDDFFAKRCQLSLDLLQHIPEKNRAYIEDVSLEADWVLNKQVYFMEDCPKDWEGRLYDIQWVKKVKPTIIMEDSVTKVISIYWLKEDQIQVLRDLISGKLLPSQLDEASLKLFHAIFVIETKNELQKRHQEWLQQLAQAREETAEKNYVTFYNLIQPVYLAITRQYLRHLMDNKYLILDKANDGTKKRYWQHRDHLTFFIHSQICTIINQFLPSPVKIGHNAITIYQPGAVLPKHIDDVIAFSLVMSIPIDTSPVREREEAWPIYVENVQTKEIGKALLGMGDGFMINPQMPHWRDVQHDHSLGILFLWFVPENYRGYVNGNWIDSHAN